MNFDIRQDTPLVSVAVVTYNHEAYIAECLDSLLMQETSFPYEICIGEDDSPDGTRAICRAYADQYPDRIRLFLRSQNEPGRDNFAAQGNYNFMETTLACRGTYLGLCEGDDAWLDARKLQKQVDIMEADPSIVLVHSDCDRQNMVAGKRTPALHRTRGIKPRTDPDPARFMVDILRLRYPITTATVLTRTAAVKEIYRTHRTLFQTLPMGDILKWCELSTYGRFHYMDEPLALYRTLEESASNSLSPTNRFRFINNASNLGLVLCKLHNLPEKPIRADKVKNCNRYALLSGDLEEQKHLRSDRAFHFSTAEKLICFACRIEPLRKLARYLFILRYNKNHAATA